MIDYESFMVLHTSTYAILPTMITGFLFGYLYFKKRNIDISSKKTVSKYSLIYKEYQNIDSTVLLITLMCSFAPIYFQVPISDSNSDNSDSDYADFIK